jgi:hypothetical protein
MAVVKTFVDDSRNFKKFRADWRQPGALDDTQGRSVSEYGHDTDTVQIRCLPAEIEAVYKLSAKMLLCGW